MAGRQDTAQQQPESRWASLYEAADYANVPHRTLREWIRKGYVPAYRTGPRQIQLDLNDLDALRRPIPTVQRDRKEAS